MTDKPIEPGDEDIEAAPAEEARADRDAKGRYLPAHNIPGPGRDTLYHPEMNDQAFKLALLGLTDEEIASYFGVTDITINNWKQEYPAFFVSLNDGKVKADAEVAHSLYRRAMGEVVYTERRYKNDATGEYELVRLSQSIPSDPGAAKLWLTNRQKALWREKVVVQGDEQNPLHMVHTIERRIVRPNSDD